jgi:hypothetical protein
MREHAVKVESPGNILYAKGRAKRLSLFLFNQAQFWILLARVEMAQTLSTFLHLLR